VINYRGQEFQLAKVFRKGTDRTCPPAETLARIEPHFGAVGLTRLANITGLDRVGIPVVLSVRPNSFYLAVDAGKGHDLFAAKASAAMETFERSIAETSSSESFRAAYDDLHRTCAVVAPEHLPLARDGVLSHRWPYRWTLAWDIANAIEIAVPTVRVTLPPPRALPQDLGTFLWDSNGLASGNSLLEAICSGLTEVIERDAITCTKSAMLTAGYLPPLIRLETVTDPICRESIDRFQSAGIAVIAFDCTNDIGISTYWVNIYDTIDEHIGGYGGYGAHLNPDIALSRALHEAAQSRLVYIAGARDDMFKRDFIRLKRARTPVIQTRPVVDFSSRSSLASEAFDVDIGVMIERLQCRGLNQVIVYDFPNALDISVVRVVVPGLEGYMSNRYQPGARAAAFAARVAS